MKYYFIASLLFCNLFAEPSAFQAGDLSSKSPYGLTSSEKLILANKKKIARLTLKISKLTQKLNTISDLFVTTTSKIDKDISSMQNQIKSIETKVVSEVANLKQEISEQASLSSKNIEQLRQALIQLTSLAKQINNKYVDKKTLLLYVKKNNVDKNKKIKPSKKISNKDKAKSGFELVEKGESLMAKKMFLTAEPIFQELIKRNYRASKSNYYLGEIYFYTHKYKKALLFYKKSVKLYAKSSFMPNLLLHSAMASYSLGKNKNAKDFLKSLMSNFPKSKEALKAKKLLVKY